MNATTATAISLSFKPLAHTHAHNTDGTGVSLSPAPPFISPRKFIKNTCVYASLYRKYRKIYGGISIKYLHFDVLRHVSAFFYRFINALIKGSFINYS